jgi:DNA-binding NarL/FixJ family response regulator
VHILVVDDFVLVELALAQVIQDTPHTLVGVRDPRSLPAALSQGTRFDLALVDISFGPGVPTGLTAMRIVRELSPDTKIVIESTDEERNRLLFLLASFLFFEPLALMSKASTTDEMRSLIDAVARGELTGPGFAAPGGAAGQKPVSRVQRLIRGSGYLDDLIRNGTDLMLWRALVRFDKRGEVARASHVDERTVDRFTASKSQVVDQIQAEFPEDASMPDAPERWHSASPRGDDPPSTPRRGASSASFGDPEQRRHPNLVRLARFAQTHSHFFGDEAIDGLFAERWQSPRPRQRRRG